MYFLSSGQRSQEMGLLKWYDSVLGPMGVEMGEDWGVGVVG